MDDTRTLSFDLTDYIERPHLDDEYRNTSPAGVVDEVDALADAREFFRGLAMALSCWALAVLIAMVVM
jgi:hypothetical protein